MRFTTYIVAAAAGASMAAADYGYKHPKEYETSTPCETSTAVYSTPTGYHTYTAPSSTYGYEAYTTTTPCEEETTTATYGYEAYTTTTPCEEETTTYTTPCEETTTYTTPCEETTYTTSTPCPTVYGTGLYTSTYAPVATYSPIPISGAAGVMAQTGVLFGAVAAALALVF